MRHSLYNFKPSSRLGESADFSQYDVVDDKLGAGDYAHDQFVLGDFSSYGSDSRESEENLMGFNDESLGKFKVKIKPKALVKAAGKVASAPVRVAAKAFAKKHAPNIPTNLAIVKPLAEAARQASQAVNQVVQTVQSAIPVEAKEAQAIFSLVEPQTTSSEVVSQGGALTQQQLNTTITPVVANKVASAIVQSKKVSHPLLGVQRKIKGEPMNGFLDELVTKVKQAATTAYQTNKDKVIAAGTAQLTNQAGNLLNKLSATSPEAQMAISQVVATATTAATAAAQESATAKAKAFYEKNKIAILAGSAGLIGLVAFSMFRKK
jgi:hypothetical protein